MGFQEQLDTFTKVRWTLARICDEMDADDEKAFRAALANPQSSPKAIYRALGSLGYKVSESTVHRWCKEAQDG